jgi:putative transport protein
MNYFVDLAVETPLFLLTTLLGLGAFIGNIKIKGISLGPAGVLFAALAFSAYDERLILAKDVGYFGLALFAYIVGIGAGPSFFRALKSGGRVVITIVVALSGAAAVLVGFAKLIGIDGPVLSGVYAGALTNTPALAASQEIWVDATGANSPIVGYSVTYLFGVLGMLIASGVAIKKVSKNAENDELALKPPKLIGETIRVDVDGLPTLGELARKFDDKIRFSRVMTGDKPGHPGLIDIATDDHLLIRGDIVTVIADRETIEKFTSQVGHSSSVALTLDRSNLDFRRIAVSHRSVAGRPLGELRLSQKYGAVATRIRRGDVDLLAHDDFVLQIGDRVRVVATQHGLSKVAKLLGDSEKAASAFSNVRLATGITAGVILGSIPFPVPGGRVFEFCMAAGPLIVGLVMGRFGKTGRIIWSLPHTASSALSHLGMMLFLAYAGSTAGHALSEAITTPIGWRLLLIGLATTASSALTFIYLGRYFANIYGPRLAGVMAGSQTQPAVLAYVNEHTNDDPRVNLGYAVAYPVGMIVKVLIAPIVGNF